MYDRILETPAGILLPVRARAGARANELRGWQDGQLKVAVTQVAEQGKANRAIIELVARCLKLRRSQISLHSGATTPQKVLLVRDITRGELLTRIQQAGDRN